nr:hypothetical protein [Tanacetum cinerariifolium]
TDEDIDEQELEAHYSYMAKIQEVPTADTGIDSEPLEQNKQTEFEKYKAFNDCTIDYDKLELKLNETLGQLAQKDIEIKEGLKTKAYELLVVKEKHDELVKHSLLKSDDERVVLANLKLNVDENKKIQKQLKKADTTLAQELKERKAILAETNKSLGESISVQDKTNDSNVIPDSPDMCEDDIQNDQNDVESDDERVALANLIANLKLNVDENKKIQKQLKIADMTLAQELKERKAILAETNKSLGESIIVQDSCLVVLQNKQTEFKKYKAFNDRTIDYDKLERKLNETLGQLAQKDIEIKEGLKTKAYELLLVKEKHDELVKHSLLSKSH